MRQILFLLTLTLVTGLLWHGCSDDEKEPNRPSGIFVRATIPATGLTQARYTSNGTTLHWDSQDAFSLYYVPEGLDDSDIRNNVKFSLHSGLGTTKAEFTPATALVWNQSAARQSFYAIYPYDEGYAGNPEALETRLDGRMWISDSKALLGAKPLMLARQQYNSATADDGVDMEFAIMTNVLAFEFDMANSSLSDQTVESVSVTLNQDLVGSLKANLMSGTISAGTESTLTFNEFVPMDGGVLALSASVLPAREENLKATVTITTTDYILIIESVGLDLSTGESNKLLNVELNIKNLLDSGEAILIANETENLSREGVANAYIVSRVGSYTIDAKIPSGDGSGTAIEGITGASWAWMTGTEGNVIAGNSIEYDALTGKISFSVVNFIPGSVVISAHDADKEILWNWHIWVTDLLRGTYSAGDMMPYNIGATSFDRTRKDHTTLGHYFQWGQPYPIIGSGVHDITGLGDEEYGDEIEPFVSSTAPNVINRSYFPQLFWNGTEGYYVPTGEYDDEGNEYYEFVSTEEIVQNDYALGVRWPTKMYAKSYNLPGDNQPVWPVMADPCPLGWRIPTIEEMGEYFGVSGPGSYTRIGTFDMEYLGVVPADHTDHWWPLAGFRWNQSSGIYQVGRYGLYHSADRLHSESGLRLIFTAALEFNGPAGTLVWPQHTGWSAHNAASVRCIKK